MVQYEVNFIVDSVLSGDEIKAAANTYKEMLESNGATIVHFDEMGLRQLAYPINNRTTGIYFCIEFQVPNGSIVNPMELAMRRDERIVRFLTVKLDKYAVQYNQDKRDGKIGKVVRKPKKEKDSRDNRDRRGRRDNRNRDEKPAPKKEAPKKEAPTAVAEAPAKPAKEAPAKPAAKEEEE